MSESGSVRDPVPNAKFGLSTEGFGLVIHCVSNSLGGGCPPGVLMFGSGADGWGAFQAKLRVTNRG